eukprot:131386-Amphidinium_carterae.1
MRTDAIDTMQVHVGLLGWNMFMSAAVWQGWELRHVGRSRAGQHTREGSIAMTLPVVALFENLSLWSNGRQAVCRHCESGQSDQKEEHCWQRFELQQCKALGMVWVLGG